MWASWYFFCLLDSKYVTPLPIVMYSPLWLLIFSFTAYELSTHYFGCFLGSLVNVSSLLPSSLYIIKLFHYWKTWKFCAVHTSKCAIPLLCAFHAKFWRPWHLVTKMNQSQWFASNIVFGPANKSNRFQPSFCSTHKDFLKGKICWLGLNFSWISREKQANKKQSYIYHSCVFKNSNCK